MDNEELFKKALEESLGENGDDFKEVKLDDEIEYGCNHCGACCRNKEVRLSQFDFYQMRKNGITQEEMMNITVPYFGDSSGMALLGIKNKDNGNCPLLEFNSEGDFVCSLGDNKPGICSTHFLSFGMKIPNDMFENGNIPTFDEFYDKCSYKNEVILYNFQERADICKRFKTFAVKKSIRDIMEYRIKYDKEIAISYYITLLVAHSINVYELFQLLYIGSHSKVCDIVDLFLMGKEPKHEEDKTYAMLTSILYNTVYAYADPDKDMSFLDQSLETIDMLKDDLIPHFKKLIEQLKECFDIDGLIDIIGDNTVKEKDKIEAFDKVLLNNVDQILDNASDYISSEDEDIIRDKVNKYKEAYNG